MARRGERIGDAYVKIHADGTSFGDDLRADLDSAQLGEDEGKQFNKGFEKGFNPKFDDTKLAKAFDRAIGRMSGRLERLDIAGSGLARQFEDLFSKTFGGDLGKQIGRNLVADIEEGMRDFTAQGLFGDLEKQVARASRELLNEFENMWDEAARMNREFDTEVQRDRDRTFDLQHDLFLRENAERRAMYDEAYSMHLNFLKKQSEDLDKAFAVRHQQNQRLAEQGKIIAQRFGDADHRMIQLFRSIRSNFTDLTKFEHAWGRIADNIGRATGRGSRNNFLNFIGSVNRNLTRTLGNLITLGPRIISVFKGAFDEFSALRQQGASFGSALTSVLGGLFATIASGIPGLIAFTAGLVLLATTAGVLVTVLSGLLAIVTALAGAISFALVGALGALLGVLAPVSAAIGVIVAGFLSLDDAQKKVLKNNLKPLTAAFRDLGDAAADHLFRDVGQWAKDLKPLIEGFRPAIVGVADAIRESIGGAIEEAATSPGFEKFQRQFNRFLPEAVSKLSNSIFNLGGAMGGIFRALIPLTREFLTWLEDITAEFSEWANSKEGQKELKEFFEDAGDAAKDVGEFLKQATKALGELFSQGQDEGRDIFLDMAKAMEDFVKWASSEEGQKAIDDWFEFGKDLADSIGDAADAVGKLFDELDTPQNRKLVLGLIDGFTKLVELTTDLVQAWNDFSDNMQDVLADVTLAVSNIGQGLRDLITINPIGFLSSPLATLQAMADSVAKVARGLASLPVVGSLFGLPAQQLTGMANLLDRVRNAIQNLPAASGLLFSKARDGAQDLLNKVGQLINRIPGVPGLRNIFQNPGRVLGQMLADLNSLISKIPGVPRLPNVFKAASDAAANLLNILQSIGDFLSRAFSFKVDWPSPPSWLTKLPGLASGGIVSGAQTRLIGEAGPEAVVPLNRPLNLVDPSVRWLSAVAQGMVPAGGGGGAGRQITIPEITVVSPVDDPAAVAREVVNIVVGSGY